jgi:uncharacterized SAM-binding protein YcdF (DUF218 family)
VDLVEIADSINTLVRFCARRDVPELEADSADVAILFGGSIVAGADLFAAAMRKGVARHYMIVGGEGHTTDALRAILGDAQGRTEAALFERYLRRRYALSPDLIEQESTNCGNNVTNALAVLRAAGVAYGKMVLIQDATMQQRMDAGFRRHAPSIQLINYAAHRTMVDDALEFVDPPAGMWALDRYVSLLMGEIPRLTDDAGGYGPAGRGFIAHVDVPDEVHRALDHLKESTVFAPRTADGRWAS